MKSLSRQFLSNASNTFKTFFCLIRISRVLSSFRLLEPISPSHPLAVCRRRELPGKDRTKRAIDKEEAIPRAGFSPVVNVR